MNWLVGKALGQLHFLNRYMNMERFNKIVYDICLIFFILSVVLSSIIAGLNCGGLLSAQLLIWSSLIYWSVYIFLRRREIFKIEDVLPTEIMFFHIGLIFVMWSLILIFLFPVSVRLNCREWFSIQYYVIWSSLIYWFIRIFLRRGKLENWWKDQVLSKEKSRISSGVGIILLDTLHILIFLFSLLLTSSNLLFLSEDNKSWSHTVYVGVVGKISDLSLQTGFGLFFSMLNSFIWLIFTALWVAIWMKAFEAVFQFFKNEQKHTKSWGQRRKYR
jgi:hypothetical protein